MYASSVSFYFPIITSMVEFTETTPINQLFNVVTLFFFSQFSNHNHPPYDKKKKKSASGPSGVSGICSFRFSLMIFVWHWVVQTYSDLVSDALWWRSKALGCCFVTRSVKLLFGEMCIVKRQGGRGETKEPKWWLTWQEAFDVNLKHPVVTTVICI